VEIKPKLSEDQVDKVRNKANSLLGKKLIIKDPESSQTWELDDNLLLTWLDLQTGDWDKQAVRDWVSQLAQTVNKDPQNATFRFVGLGRVEEFKPAKNGVAVLEENTADSIIVALNLLDQNAGPQYLNLAVRDTQPEIATGDVNNLGIKELIGKGESWYRGSITNRIFNLKKAADLINGVLVAPGEIFSFNKSVGEVSQNTGFKQAYIIKEGKTILGDGGGVCQVSTTLFRAVLAAGLPIEARTAHAYRVSYYEVNYQPGFDATVFQPNPDFQFRNDTNAYILIQTVYDEKAQYLSFELYGTSDGRKVEMSKARVWDVTPPPPDLYQDDPTLPVGKVTQTEHAAWGAKVAFDWKVTRGDEVLQQKTFFSDYKPWQAVYLRGTKTN
jgi:vancomycin resistance protein YoaR